MIALSSLYPTNESALTSMGVVYVCSLQMAMNILVPLWIVVRWKAGKPRLSHSKIGDP
jgi:hypothetical protein